MPSEAVQRVLDRLDALGCTYKGNDAKGYDAQCPAHDDHDPSFTLNEGADGRALVWCGAGCTVDQIASAMSLDVRDLFEREAERPDKLEIVAVYPYLNALGKKLFEVVRFDPKTFRQRRPDGAGGWIWNLQGVIRVLYHWPEVIAGIQAGKLICLCEGEKDADALIAKGQVATTNPGGAGKWRDAYAQQMAKVAADAGKTLKVAIFQDVDKEDPKTGHRPGQEHAEEARKSLEAVEATVKVLQPAVGKDVSDHLNAGMKLGQFLPAAEPRKPARLEIVPARDIMALPELGEEGFLLGPLIYAGHRIVVGGWTGHGKTTFTMHMVSAACYGREFLRAGWKGRTDKPIKALVIDVEQGTKSVKRVLRETGLENSERVQYLRVPDGLALDSDPEAISFLEKSFATGRFDIVLADPLYKLHRGDPNDTKAATELMRRFDDWRERFGFALVLPMHCRKSQEQRGAPKLSPHDLFGSSAYQWGAEMLMGVERKSPGMTWVHWWKDREGEAAEQGAAVGSHWGVRFDRKKGFQRYVEGKQERLPIEVAPTPKFDLGGFIQQQIRALGSVTREDVKKLAWQKHHMSYRMDQIDTALANIGQLGVTFNGARKLGDRVYFFQDELSPNGSDPGGVPGSESNPTQPDQGGDDQEVGQE